MDSSGFSSGLCKRLPKRGPREFCAWRLITGANDLNGSVANRSRGGRLGQLAWLVVCLALAAGLPLGLGGCSGCRSDPDSDEASDERAAQREEPLPDFELERFVRQPSDKPAPAPLCKPGHWGQFELVLKANNFDYLGELRLTAADRQRQPLSLPGTPYGLTAARDVALAKGRPKRLSVDGWAPRPEASAFFDLELSAGEGTYRETTLGLSPVEWMPSYQYDVVALARTPTAYGYLRTLPAMTPPWDKLESSRPRTHYRVYLPQAEPPLPFPDDALFWTSIAYVVWDDVDAGLLRPEQQRAMLDWLHWGGQLIVSGPDTLDTLRGSFLEPYLAATSEGAWEFGDDDFQPLERNFGFVDRAAGGGQLVGAGRSTGVRLRLRSDAQEVPGTGGLLAERRVGRGRIVVSAFRLSGRQVTAWSGVDSFWNACLLRRPPREWYVSELNAATRIRWLNNRRDWFDPRPISSVRYFTRDAGRGLSEIAPDLPQPDPESTDWADAEMLDLPERQGPVGGGVAAWDDFNPASQRARRALLDAARVEVPRASFVLWVVTAYLAVLVPLNWGVFYLLGRVEWAWLAAPIISIACTVLVIRLAQLDVGFARSTTEISVAELQGDYARAHVTRYHALYTSLTTRYTLSADEGALLAQPFPRLDDPGDFRLLPGQRIGALRYAQDRGWRLGGLAVLSNSTGLVHSEQMVDLDGPLALGQSKPGRWQLGNHTGWTLRDVGVVQKIEDNKVRVAWVGDVRPAVVKPVRFGLPKASDEGPRWFEESRPAEGRLGRRGPPGTLSVASLAELAQTPASLERGEIVVTGWFEEEIPGLVIAPAAPQARRATLVVAHYELDFGPDPERDRNLREHVEREDRRTVEPEAVDEPAPTDRRRNPRG